MSAVYAGGGFAMFKASRGLFDLSDEHFPIISHPQGSEKRYFPTLAKWLR
jgi:hypothetical protein